MVWFPRISFLLFRGDEVVRFRFGSQSLRDLMVELWETGDGELSPRSWLALTFTIADGKFDAKFTYLDQVDSEEDLADRRPRVVDSYFPALKIDYSKPRG